MFRTSGAGFAIPCSEDGTPAGTLYETTGVQANYVLVTSETPHTIGFTSYGDDPYGHIVSLDGQEGTIAASRATNLKTKSISEDVANKSELPAKTSELSNDSGFITSADVPTKTSDLTNDSGFITSADIITKRDLNDLNIYADPMAEHTPIEVTVWHNDEISTLYVLNWNGSSWYYTDGSTSIQIYFDGYSNHYILTGSVQDMGGTQRNINGQFDLTSPLWSVTFETQYFYKIEIASIKAHIATKEYVDSRLSALEARIAALEGN